MKAKVLFIGAVCAMSVYSCSPERDEQAIENPVEKLDLMKKEINNPSGTENKIESDTIKGLNPYNSPSSGTSSEPVTFPEPDPNDPELIPPGDIRPPKGGK